MTRAQTLGRAWPVASAVGVAAVLALSACGSSGSSATASAASSSSPGTSFKTAKVAGLGTVLVDARGHTVYLLTSADHKNLPCDDASGCTKVWPDLPLPGGTAAATAGSGVKASLLGTMKLSDGETYPTYNSWLLYEYAGDTGAAQEHGEGIQSFGGTWYALSPSGDPVTSSSASTATGGGY